MIQSISAASYVHSQLICTGSSGLIMNVEQSHLRLFVVKQAPLPSENLHDSGRNVRRRGDVLKFYSYWVWSCQPTSFLFVCLCCYSNRQLNEPHWKMYEEMSHSISLTKPCITFIKSFSSPFSSVIINWLQYCCLLAVVKKIKHNGSQRKVMNTFGLLQNSPMNSILSFFHL